MELICYRTGRDGFKIGDVIEVPDDVDQFDRVTFRVLASDNDPLLHIPVPNPSGEEALNAQLETALFNDNPDDPDKAE